MPPPKHKTLQVLPPLKTPFNNIELQNHDRRTQNTMSCSQATHYNTRTKAAALDVYQNDPESASPVIANAANNIRQHSLDELHTNQVYTLPYASITYVSLLRLPNHRFVLIYFTLYDLYCILFHPHLYIHYRLYFF